MKSDVESAASWLERTTCAGGCDDPECERKRVVVAAARSAESFKAEAEAANEAREKAERERDEATRGHLFKGETHGSERDCKASELRIEQAEARCSRLEACLREIAAMDKADATGVVSIGPLYSIGIDVALRGVCKKARAALEPPQATKESES